MAVFCISYNFLGARFFDKVKSVTDIVFKVEFITLIIILSGAPIFIHSFTLLYFAHDYTKSHVILFVNYITVI